MRAVELRQEQRSQQEQRLQQLQQLQRLQPQVGEVLLPETPPTEPWLHLQPQLPETVLSEVPPTEPLEVLLEQQGLQQAFCTKPGKIMLPK